MVITLYVMPVSSPCRAVVMTAKYLGLDVNVEEVNLFVGDNRNMEFSKINPRGCLPTIDDDGFRLWESRAIMTYLANKYATCSSIYPRDPQKRATVDMMLSFDQGTIYKTQVEYLYPEVFLGKMSSDEKKINYQSSLILLDHTLSSKKYVAGSELTLADLSIVANIALAEAYDYDFHSLPHIQAWLNLMKETVPYYREINDIPLLQFKLCGNCSFYWKEHEELQADTKL